MVDALKLHIELLLFTFQFASCIMQGTMCFALNLHLE